MHPGLGYATFCAIKFAGYTAAAHFLSMSYDRDDLASWKVGAVRTLIGMDRRCRLFRGCGI